VVSSEQITSRIFNCPLVVVQILHAVVLNMKS